VKWLVFVVLAACDPPPLDMSEYPCPPAGTQLTYDNFGAQFLGDTCNTCHSAETGYRHGAPDSFRFDTLDEVQQRRARIFVRAAASNTSMPPGPVDPPTDQRDRLAEWLACGAP
jgi:uncharacterized membrane protein